MNLKRINSFLVNRHIALTAVKGTAPYLLLKVTADKEYKDNAYTDTIIGYSYLCVDTADFDRIRVKIEGQKNPVITNEKLQELRQAGENILVTFENATVFAYVNAEGILTDSIKASGVELVDTELQKGNR